MSSSTEIVESRTNGSVIAGLERETGSVLCIGARSSDEPARLSFAQERLWFLDQINPGDVSLNLSRAARLRGRLNREALEQVFVAIVARHEILRTTFARNEHHAGTDGQPVQLISKTAAVDFAVIDLSGEPEAQRVGGATAKARAECQKPFDMTLGPLLRLRLFRIGDNDHILVLVAHRIIADPRSLEIFFSELWAGYQAIVDGETPPLPELRFQFADYASSEREWLRDQILEGQLRYWTQELAEAPAVLELPADRGRPATQSWRGGSCSLSLGPDLTRDLGAMAQRQGVTLSEIALTAFQTLLARYSGQRDVVIGSVDANRDHDETRSMIGPLANEVVQRADLASELSFADLLQRARATLEEQRAFRLMPFAKLLEELQVGRSLSHTPVFQILFDFRPSPIRGAETETLAQTDAPLQIEDFCFDAGIVSYDLRLEVRERAEQLDCCLEFNRDLFDAETANQMLGHFRQVLSSAAINPAQSIGRIELLTRPERQQLLREWNETQDSVQATSVVQLFEAQVERVPDAPAASFNGETLSYRELNERANQLAHHLTRLGIGPDACVGICLERSLEMVIAVLATLKAGGAYVPLDPSYPAERLRFMVEDSQCSVLLMGGRTADSVPATNGIVFCLADETEKLRSESITNPVAAIMSENLAYLIYTSGSTGQPKGVAMTHRALTNMITWQLKESPLPLRTLQFASLSFDVSFQEMFSTWSNGGTLLLIPGELRRDAGSLLSFLDEQQVERLFLPFVYLQHLAEAAELSGAALGGLREIITAGEQLEITPELARWFGRLKNCRLYNHYGPSETHVVTRYSLTGTPLEWPSLPPIGRPIANTQIYIVDSNFEPVPPGVPGEVCVGGDSLARGYLNRPAATAEKFVPDPFGETAGARLYRTGDLACYSRDGNIEFLGRLDHQVKIRGFRIEIGEIEATLRSHPVVRDVVVRSNEKKDALIAFVVADRGKLNDGETTLTAELRRHVANVLPDHMVPAIFIELESLPLTPSGKVNRRALLITDEYHPESSEQYVAPRNEVEATLVKLWQQVLGAGSVGVKDNFFELGGHSLLASRLFAQIQNRFGRNLPLAALFQSPTIEHLARLLQEDSDRSWSSLVAIQPSGARLPLFCVHAAGANVLIYRPLARHLGPDQPVYALQARGLDGRTEPFTRVEDMATHYLKEVRAFQPRGPYLLLGASFGGLVAYEMARQLLAEGQQVALLAMLNTDCPVFSFGKRIRCHVGNFINKGPKPYLGAVSRSLLRRVSPRADAAIGEALWNRELQAAIESKPDRSDPLIRTVLANLEAETDYRSAARYPGKITYFWARDAAADYADNRRAWQRLASGGFDLHVIPGDHGTMREEPNIAVLVDKLRPELERVRTSRP